MKLSHLEASAGQMAHAGRLETPPMTFLEHPELFFFIHTQNWLRGPIWAPKATATLKLTLLEKRLHKSSLYFHILGGQTFR